MRSCVVITSWWSNSLALTAIRRFMLYAPRRTLLVMQAGKSPAQMERFRQLLPAHVRELHYPEGQRADDSAMREYLAKVALKNEAGIWFFDHDAFLTQPCEAWFEDADARLERSGLCLCTRPPQPGFGVTQPAYWLSPARWPDDLPSFDPVPFVPRPHVERPDLERTNGRLALPGKDTLVQAREAAETRGLAGAYPVDGLTVSAPVLPDFPPHLHLGGLHLYTGPAEPPPELPPTYLAWRRSTLRAFDDFFRRCPPDWRAAEDPELRRRHAEMMALTPP